MKKARAVILARVSTRKQAVSGDPQQQIDQCREFIIRNDWEVAEVFEIVESARSDSREDFDEVIRYCLDKRNEIDYLVFREISRLTRGGSDKYLQMKKKLEAAGVKLRDVYGVIRDTVNVFDDLGLEFEFSCESPTEKQETSDADEAKSSSKKALRTMFRPAINYVRLGYWSRQPLYGFKNVKIDTDEGERTIMEIFEKEARYMRKIFYMRADGCSDKEIVGEVNSMGFKTRLYKKRDKTKKKKVIGFIGNNPLTIKQMQKMIKNPAYCGFVCEKWTLNKLVKAQFKGLVPIDIYNAALKGKQVIKLVDGKYELLLNQKPIVRLKNNPLYPFKNLKCHICDKEILGSAPRSKSGKHSKRYHCGGKNRGHKYWSVNKKDFENNIYDFIGNVDFTDDYFQLFRQVVLDVWRQKQQVAVDESLIYGQRANDLRAEKKLLIEKIKSIDSKIVIEELSKEIERVNGELKVAETRRNVKEEKEHDIDLLLTYAEYFMEHLEELLIDRDNPVQQRSLFEFLFDEMPSYEKIVSGTPDLSLVFKLNQDSTLSKSEMVTPWGIEPQLQG